MSKYTTELRYICESLANLPDPNQGMSVNAVVRVAAPLIFNFPFPMFDQDNEGNSAYKTILTEKILRHYYTREICEETYGLWKLRLNDKMNIIMPYYNQLYKSALLEFNPFYDGDITREHSGSNIGNSSSTTGVENEREDTSEQNKDISTARNTKNNREQSESNSSTSKYSDTPQGAITDLAGDGYLTNANIVNGSDSITDNAEMFDAADTTEKNNYTSLGSSTQNTEQKSEVSNMDEYIEKVKGKQGSSSYSEMLIKFRQTFLNVDKMILDELENLFFGLW